MADLNDNRTDRGSIDYRRRSVLMAGGMTLAAAIGVPFGSAEEHEDEFTEEEILTLFEIVVEDEGVEIADTEIEEEGLLGSTILSVEYYPLGTSEEEIAEEIGYITGAFAEAVNMGLEVERLEATALDIADEPVSEWYIETEWVEAYNEGEMTANEVAMEALLTLEPVQE